MQQSKDIVILDPEDQVQELSENTLKINDSKVNFDSLLDRSNQMTQQSKKSKMQRNLDYKISKQEQQINKVVQDVTEIEEKQNLIYVIQKYQSSERFGSYIQNELNIRYTGEQLNKKKLYELNAILQKIRLHLDNKNLSNLYDGVLLSSTVMIEKFSQPFANVDGFSKMIMTNDEFLNCFERVKCESLMPTIPNHIQLMLILGQTYFMVYTMNKMKKNSDSKPDKVIVDNQIETNTDVKNNDTNEEKPIEKPIIENGMGL